MEISAKIKYGDLEKLVEAMSKNITLKVGLLKGKGGDADRGNDMDNAAIGAIHEFGADIKITPKMAAFLAIHAKELGLPPKPKGSSDGYIHIPVRSFLQMPLTRKNAVLKELKKQIGDIEEFAYWLTKTGDLKTLAIMLGAAAKEVILQAFETQGFGQWPPNSEYTIAIKGSNKPLEDEGSLKNSIDFEVE